MMKKTQTIVVMLLASFFIHPILAATGAYMGQQRPGMRPEIFAPGFISVAGRFERTPNLHPNGREFYFTVIEPDHSDQDIYYTTCDELGQWSEPRQLHLSGFQISADLSLTGDGNTLCFTSNKGNPFFWNNDVWLSHRREGGWDEPIRLPDSINTTDGEWGACLLNNGTLYFSRQFSSGNSDIFRSRLVEGEYETPTRVEGVQSGVWEWDPFVAEDESYMVFKSNRAGGFGGNDLYISFRDPQSDTWARPRNLGPTINTPKADDGGNLTPDGKYFMFVRRNDNIDMDIYWVDIRAILPDPNGPIQNENSGQRFGSIQCAINYARTGDTIVLQPSTYKENIILNKNVTLRSLDPNDPYHIGGTVIEGVSDKPVLTLHDHTDTCTIAGLTLRAGSVGIVGSATHATLRHCRILDNVTHGMELSQVSHPRLEHCLITANGQNGIFIHASHGGRRGQECEPVLERCIIVGNNSAAMIGGSPVLMDSLIVD